MTNGGSGSSYGEFSTAARASQWVDRVRSIYPDTQLWSGNQITGVLGDVNQDGSFNDSDVDAFVAGWRSPTPENLTLLESYQRGNLNHDGQVSLADFVRLRAAFNSTGQVGRSLDALLTAHEVPEPSAILTCWLGLSLLQGIRIRRSVQRDYRPKRTNAYVSHCHSCRLRGSTVVVFKSPRMVS